MLLMIVPFGLLIALVEWQHAIQIGAALFVVGFGIFRLIRRPHPRALARIGPTRLALWSFAIAIACGAGFMLVPIFLGLCRTADLGRRDLAASILGKANFGMAILVSAVHSAAIIIAGGLLALAGRPSPRSQVCVAESVQSRCHLGFILHWWACLRFRLVSQPGTD
jgi:hypothetical protein